MAGQPEGQDAQSKEKAFEPPADVDRWVAIVAALSCSQKGSETRWLFGTGYYTHRYEMVSCVREVARHYNYSPPPGYATIVRPATFSALLVDCGLLGVILFALLIGVSALRAFRSSATFKYGILGSLLFVGFSTIVSLNYDVVLLYLMLMPGGALMALLPPAGAPASR